jgi:hypothetical protein
MQLLTLVHGISIFSYEWEDNLGRNMTFMDCLAGPNPSLIHMDGPGASI